MRTGCAFPRLAGCYPRTLILFRHTSAVIEVLMTPAMLRFKGLALSGLVLVACENEPPPRTVTEFMEDPIMLEAAVVRCARDRAESRYDVECINARQAVKIIEAREEVAERERLEAESERKREALRRSQQAADEARRLAEAERRQQEEAGYLAQFGEEPPELRTDAAVPPNAPVALLPEPPESAESPETPAALAPAEDTTALSAELETDEVAPDLAPPIGSEGVEATPPDAAQTDLGEIREALRQRSANDPG